MSHPENQEESTIILNEEEEAQHELLFNLGTGQPQINVINIQQHVQQVIQQDNRQFPSTSYPTNVQSEDEEGLTKAFCKLKQTTGKLYDPKFDVDVSKFDISPANFPEVYPELLSVDFYEGRCIPSDDQYDPKAKQIEFTESDENVSIEKLLSHYEAQNFISIVGYPGAGKTTLSKRLARRLNHDGDFLVLRILFMSMSDCDDENLTLSDFLLGDVNLNLEEEEKQLIFNWIKNHTENCFLILDGFDQVNWNLIEKVQKSGYNTLLTYQELVSNLCQGIFLRNCHILFTSRPHAMLEIPSKCRPTQTYFIRDLTSENLKKVFDAIVNNVQKASKCWNELTVQTPHLESMCHNPLMLQLYLRALLCSSHGIANIYTMTRMFHTVLLNLRASGHAVSLSDSIVIKLSKLAYESTQKGTVLITAEDLQNESLSSQEVQDIVVTLFGSNRRCGLLEGNRRLYFCHQTFQEFFAALYVIHQMSLENFRSFVKNNLLGDHWSVVVQFLSGLLLDPYMNRDGILQKKEIFILELNKKTREVAASHSWDSGRSFTLISKILRESSDVEVMRTTGRCYRGGQILMYSSDTQNDFHAANSFLKLIPARIGMLALTSCRMTSNKFFPWIEAIKSMPGSIVRLVIDHNYLSSVDDVIAILHKVECGVLMQCCLDDGRGGRRSADMEERAKLQEALNAMENKELEINISPGEYLTHKDR